LHQIMWLYPLIHRVPLSQLECELAACFACKSSKTGEKSAVFLSECRICPKKELASEIPCIFKQE
ncbi:MAG TPA: hypothetical protein VF458_21340, partial [Ktedonobacteraceae bacterium]